MVNTFTLQNGIRIIHKSVQSEVAHCCLLINTGTRDESDLQIGIAHFTEHMLFKGTSKRKAFHLLNRLETVGGEVDAFTTKEETCISASFLNEFYARTIELFNDAVFGSIFPQKEIDKEAAVIEDEINSYNDNPAENIFDEFEISMFPNHPLGHNILGNKKTLRKYKTADFCKFVSEKYNTDQMVFCSIGNIDFRKLIDLCEKYFGSNPAKLRSFVREPFTNRVQFEKTVKKKFSQANTLLGTYCYSYNDPKRVPLVLISNILAGPGMNSRLNLLLREKHGLSYNIESNFTCYQDTGLFSIFFSSDHETADYASEIIFKELKRMKEEKLGVLQLSRAKKQLIGQVAIENDANSNMLFPYAKSFMNYGSVETFRVISAQIEAITAEELLHVANEIFADNGFSIIKYL